MWITIFKLWSLKIICHDLDTDIMVFCKLCCYLRRLSDYVDILGKQVCNKWCGANIVPFKRCHWTITLQSIQLHLFRWGLNNIKTISERENHSSLLLCQSPYLNTIELFHIILRTEYTVNIQPILAARLFRYLHK